MVIYNLRIVWEHSVSCYKENQILQFKISIMFEIFMLTSSDNRMWICRALSCVYTVYMNMGTKMLYLYLWIVCSYTKYYIFATLTKENNTDSKTSKNETTIKTKTTI